jgi:colicin import membrane protein
MNRLEKKCIMASTAFHGTLIGILLFGSALMPSPDDKAFKPLTVYSAAAVSDALSSGGNPEARVAPNPPAPVAPPQEQTPPTPKPLVQPPAPKPVEQIEPPKPRREIPKPQEERVEIPKVEKITKAERLKAEKIKLDPKPEKAAPVEPHKIVLSKNNLKQAVRKTDDRERVAREAAENAAIEARRNAAKEFTSAYRSLSKTLSSSTVVEAPGNGAPGELSVNYRDLIASKYYNAWTAPTDLDDSTPVVTASVTIDRDGNVKSARIVTPSGNRSMDRSILNVLSAVTFFEPFSASMKEQEMTVSIKFNLLAKRGTG